MSNLQEEIDYQVSLVLQESVNGFNMREFKAMDFMEQRKYAAEHLEQLGEGSARVAFLLSSRFVLKMATPSSKKHLLKGVGQNEAELDLFTDPRMKPILAKIFDYDDKNKRVMWLVVELVRPLKSREFRRKIGFSPEVVKRALKLFVNADYDRAGAISEIKETIGTVEANLARATEEEDLGLMEYFGDALDEAERVRAAMDSPFVQTIMELEDEFALHYGDVARAEHWGKTADDRIVLLDYGYTEDVADQYYT